MSNKISKEFRRSRLQLMLRHPYLASAVARLPIVDASDMPWCNTMATDGYYIYVEPAFCKTLSEAEITAVLAHELLHCILGHMDRRGERDRSIWNIAIDHAVNLLLTDMGFELPKVGLLDRRYRGMTSEEIYKSIMQADATSGGGELGSGQNGSDSETKDGSDKTAPGGFDAHIEPGDLEGSSNRAKDYPSVNERTRLRANLGTELKNNLPGKEAGYYADEIQKAGQSHVTWQQLLARFFSGLRRDDYRTFPFNHKHLWRKIYLPSIGVPGPEHIVIAIDTSGSMSEEDLAAVLSELDALRATAQCKLTIIQCDVVIHSVKEYDAWELTEDSFKKASFMGRGGTSLIPPFQWVSENILQKGQSLDALVYFTDGYGSFPQKEPGFSTLWLVPKNGFQSPPFGELIRIG